MNSRRFWRANREEEVAEQLSVVQCLPEGPGWPSGAKLGAKQMKSMASELNMYQAQLSEYKYEVERLTRELQDAKRNYESKRRDQLARELDAEERDLGALQAQTQLAASQSAAKTRLPVGASHPMSAAAAFVVNALLPFGRTARATVGSRGRGRRCSYQRRRCGPGFFHSALLSGAGTVRGSACQPAGNAAQENNGRRTGTLNRITIRFRGSDLNQIGDNFHTSQPHNRAIRHA